METIGVVLLFLVLALVAYLAFRPTGAPESAATLGVRLDMLDRSLERVERLVREEFSRGRAEASSATLSQRDELRALLASEAAATLHGIRNGREETVTTLTSLTDSVARRLTEVQALLKSELDSTSRQVQKLSQSNEDRLDKLRIVLHERLEGMQKENAAKLDEMRATVDEKLQGTLEKRLGESFRLVSSQLEAVQRGLGEMQSLATGVGDLRRVLSNVKVRGTLGEVQLGALLEQILSPSQFLTNVVTRGEGGERVEFAIRLPGVDDGAGEVLLPIDAKFPLEDYARLVEASERGDALSVEAAAKALETRVKNCARDIQDKYLWPPRTTDFGILYLPLEGLFAEVVRRAGLVETLQRQQKVLVAGPTTLTAILNSLQMGFRTLAITKRSSEVWQVLGAVKAEWAKFGEVLAKVEKKLGEASHTITEVHRRQRALSRKLDSVEQLPAPAALPALAGVGANVPQAEDPLEEPA